MVLIIKYGVNSSIYKLFDLFFSVTFLSLVKIFIVSLM